MELEVKRSSAGERPRADVPGLVDAHEHRLGAPAEHRRVRRLGRDRPALGGPASNRRVELAPPIVHRDRPAAAARASRTMTTISPTARIPRRTQTHEAVPVSVLSGDVVVGTVTMRVVVVATVVVVMTTAPGDVTVVALSPPDVVAVVVSVVVDSATTVPAPTAPAASTPAAKSAASATSLDLGPATRGFLLIPRVYAASPHQSSSDWTPSPPSGRSEPIASSSRPSGRPQSLGRCRAPHGRRPTGRGRRDRRRA